MAMLEECYNKAIWSACYAKLSAGPGTQSRRIVDVPCSIPGRTGRKIGGAVGNTHRGKKSWCNDRRRLRLVIDKESNMTKAYSRIRRRVI